VAKSRNAFLVRQGFLTLAQCAGEKLMEKAFKRRNAFLIRQGNCGEWLLANGE